jgi:hypothetical protein
MSAPISTRATFPWSIKISGFGIPLKTLHLVRKSVNVEKHENGESQHSRSELLHMKVSHDARLVWLLAQDLGNRKCSTVH